MCLSEPHIQLPPPPVRDSEDCKTFTSTLDTMACRPSWTLRGLFKPQASRPGLPRRFHTKINLNEYWGALEKVVKVEVSFPTQQATPHPSPATMDLDNEVNDNLANERTEQKMEVDQEDDQEEDKEGIAEEQVVEAIVAKVTTPPKLQVRPLTEPSPTGRQKKRRSSRRPSGSPGAAPACSPACGPPAPSPCRRTPLGTINGMAGREHLRKNLSPLAVFAENLARRLNRQY